MGLFIYYIGFWFNIVSWYKIKLIEMLKFEYLRWICIDDINIRSCGFEKMKFLLWYFNVKEEDVIIYVNSWIDIFVVF